MRAKQVFYATLAFVFLTLVPCTEVWADTLDYTYQLGDNTLTWQLPSSPTIPPEDVYGTAFTISDVFVTENGGSTVDATLTFYSPASGGGFDLYIGDFFYLGNAFGPQLYSGPESNPILLTGTYSFDDIGNSDGETSCQGNLQVTSVPEPSSLSLMVIGLFTGLGLYSLHRFLQSAR
jgi:hypothetical protein